VPSRFENKTVRTLSNPKIEPRSSAARTPKVAAADQGRRRADHGAERDHGLHHPAALDVHSISAAILTDDD
jgi:hypothetical protein